MPQAAKIAEPLAPNEAEMQQAKCASRALASLAGRDRVRVEAVADGVPPQTFILPAKAVQLLTDMLAHLSQGNAVAVLPDNAELTTQQAADLLNVSRPYLVRLIESGAIPYHKAGTHRRITLSDLLDYRDKKRIESQAALDELTAQAQDLDLGY